MGQHGKQLLQEQHGTTKKAAAFQDKQMLDQLNNAMKRFISQQDMMFISTADSRGNCHSSIRTGASGFVRIINDKTLIYPEYKGNGVMDSLGNIIENPHIGLMFIDFAENQIGLHVNGKAFIVEKDQLSITGISDEIINNFKVEEGKRAERWVVIKVEKAYIHCSKHIPKLQKVKKEKLGSGDFFKVRDKGIEDHSFSN